MIKKKLNWTILIVIIFSLVLLIPPFTLADAQSSQAEENKPDKPDKPDKSSATVVPSSSTRIGSGIAAILSSSTGIDPDIAAILSSSTGTSTPLEDRQLPDQANSVPYKKTKAEYNARYNSFSSKIHPHVLDILSHDNPGLIAKDLRETFQGDKLLVEVHLKEGSENDIPALLKVVTQNEQKLLALINYYGVNRIAQDDAVEIIKLPVRGVPRGHLDPTDVLDFIDAETMHSSLVTGKGARIAVLAGAYHAGDSEYASNVIVRDPGEFCSVLDCTNIDGIADHGSAIVEIITEIAPDAQLILYPTQFIEFNYETAVQDILDRNDVDIAVIPMTFPTQGGDGTLVGLGAGKFRDGTSGVSGEINDLWNGGVLPIVSIGNQGQSHFGGAYDRGGGPITTDGVTALQLWHNAGIVDLMNFRPGAASKAQQACLRVDDNGGAYHLTWNQWPSPGHLTDPDELDLDFFLVDVTNTFTIPTGPGLAEDLSEDPQSQENPKVPPIETFQVVEGEMNIRHMPPIPTVADNNMCLVVGRFGSAGLTNTFVHVNVESNLLKDTGCGPPPTADCARIRPGSLDTPADATNAFAVSSVTMASGGTNFPGTFFFRSSAGPTEHPSPLPRPSLCAAENIGTSQSNAGVKIGDPDKGFVFPYYDFNTVDPMKGTSAAAATTAGAAALLLEQDQSITTPQQLKDALLANTASNFVAADRCTSGGVLNLNDPIIAGTQCGRATNTFNLIQGTSAGETLTGTHGDDLIFGGGGDDNIQGNGGDDCIFGGGGNDKISGGDGNDTIDGGAGDDDITGRAGDDTLTGGADTDNVNGGAGTDSCTGEIVAECES